MKSLKTRSAPGSGAHAANPQAARLAAAINAGGDLETLVRDATIDAIVHRDWSRIDGLELSLKRIEQRTRAREISTLAGRGCFVSRTDRGRLAAAIPDGYDHGIAWLVCAVFALDGGDYDAAVSLANNVVSSLRGKKLPDGIIWPDGDVALASTHQGFGPPNRVRATTYLFEGDLRFLERVQEYGRRAEAEMDEYAGGRRKESLSFITWGCIVTGAESPAPLFEVPCPVDDRDLSNAANVITQAIAAEAAEADYACYVHPELVSAQKAYDCAMWMQREESTDAGLYDLFGPDQPVRGVVAPLVAPGIPYMDQLLVALWTTYGGAKTSFRFPRSWRPLEADVEQAVQMLKDRGVDEVTVVTPQTQRDANSIGGLTIDDKGRWHNLREAFDAPLRSILRHRHWRDPSDNAPDVSASLAALPAPLLLNRLGAPGFISEHFQKRAADAIKESWSHPGDPARSAEQALCKAFPKEAETLRQVAEHEAGLLTPRRDVALSIQFKLAGGACAVITPALQRMLDDTDIGDDVTNEMLRPPFDIVYLHYRRPWEFSNPIDDDEDDEDEDGLDGVMVQLVAEGESTKLQLDGFIVGSSKSEDFWDRLPVDIVSVSLDFDPEATLGDLRQQARRQDGAGSPEAEQLVRLVTGALLYMNSRDARMVRSGGAGTKAASGAGPVRAVPGTTAHDAVTFDCILVGPEEPANGDTSGAGKRTVKTHYRRGHVRVRQRVGKGRLGTRPVFIAPMLINAKHLRSGEPLPPKKDYIVGDSTKQEK